MQEQGMARRGGAAFIWKWGAICGVVLGVIQIIISLLPLGSLKTILDLLLWLIGFFVLLAPCGLHRHLPSKISIERTKERVLCYEKFHAIRCH